MTEREQKAKYRQRDNPLNWGGGQSCWPHRGATTSPSLEILGEIVRASVARVHLVYKLQLKGRTFSGGS